MRRLPLDARRAAALDDDARDAGMGFEHGAVCDGVAHILDDEPLRIPHLAVVVARSADETVAVQTRHVREQLLTAEQPPIRQRLARRQQIVERQADADLPAFAPRAAVDGNAELERLDEVRSKRQQPFALAQRLADEAELEVLEITQPAVDEPRRRAAGPGADIAALDEQHLDAAERRLARDRRPIDPRPNNNELVARLSVARHASASRGPPTHTNRVASVRESPFGSVGARDGADAAYRDVLAAVPKGLSRAGAARDRSIAGVRLRSGWSRPRPTQGRIWPVPRTTYL